MSLRESKPVEDHKAMEKEETNNTRRERTQSAIQSYKSSAY